MYIINIIKNTTRVGLIEYRGLAVTVTLQHWAYYNCFVNMRCQHSSGVLGTTKNPQRYVKLSRVLIYSTLIFCKFKGLPHLGCNLVHKHFQGLLRT